MEDRKGTCICGAEFIIPNKPGRRPINCLDCREARKNGTYRDRLIEKGIDPDLVQQRRIELRTSLDPQQAKILAQRQAQEEEDRKRIRSKARVDHLEILLRAQGTHISQHRNGWY